MHHYAEEEGAEQAAVERYTCSHSRRVHFFSYILLRPEKKNMPVSVQTVQPSSISVSHAHYHGASADRKARIDTAQRGEETPLGVLLCCRCKKRETSFSIFVQMSGK